MYQQPTYQQPKKGWWSRNWKWAVPVGCITPLLLCGGGVMAIFIFVFGSIKSSEPYQEALMRAKANEELKAAIGAPIEESFWMSGSIEVNNGSGKADLAFPVSGPNGSATIFVVATKSAGRWEYSKMEATMEGSRRINLLSPGAKGAPK
jgi:hypothetical protein